MCLNKNKCANYQVIICSSFSLQFKIRGWRYTSTLTFSMVKLPILISKFWVDFQNESCK